MRAMRVAPLLFLVACGHTPPPQPVANAPVAATDRCGPGHAEATRARAAGLAGDEVSASTLWGQACKAGDGAGCYGLGTQYNLGSGGMAKDKAHAEELFAQATPLLDRACAVDCADACATRAWTLHTGQGRGEDDQAALAGMTKACELGSGEGCFLLSQMFAFGYGTAVDPAAADRAARKSCELHDALGCNTVAFGYEEANHAAEGKPFHEQACKLGLKQSCAKLTGAAPSHGE